MTGSGAANWYVDDQVTSCVLDVIRDAEEFVYLISPYLTPWGHFRTAVELAARKSVPITVFVRKDPDGKIAGTKKSDGIKWLTDLGATVKTVGALHSKIYLNERSVVVSSMNLLASSSQGSHEFAIEVPPGPMSQQVREYVDQRLAGLAEPLAEKTAGKPRRNSRPTVKAKKATTKKTTKKKSATSLPKITSHSSPLTVMGYTTAKPRNERHELLLEEAIPEFGLERVIEMIGTFISRRKDNAVNQPFAMAEWRHDLEFVKKLR